MGLFNKKQQKSGNIPEGLGIVQNRANEIIEAIAEKYSEHSGNINAVIDDIKEEKLPENEAIFAYYAMGCIKTKREMPLIEGLKDMDNILSLLEKIAKELWLSTITSTSSLKMT